MRDVGPLMYATVRDDTLYTTPAIMTHTNSPHAFEPPPYFRFAAEFTDTNSPQSEHVIATATDNQRTHESPHERRLMTAVQRRKNSIEMFLSQSPSQALGNGFLKLSLEDEEKGLEALEGREGVETLELEREPTPEHHLREDEWNQERLYYYDESLQPLESQEGYYDHSTLASRPNPASWSGMAVQRPYTGNIPQYSPSIPRPYPYPTQIRPTMRSSPASTTRYAMYPPSSTNGLMMERSPSPSPSSLYAPSTNGLTSPLAMMKPCKFFVQGHCRMGNKCKFVHHLPQQQQLYSYAQHGLVQEASLQHYTMRMEEPYDVRVSSRPALTPMGSGRNMSSYETNSMTGSSSMEPILQMEDVIHRVFAMSKDQNGCRLLQEQLDVYEERKEVCDVIYNEAMNHLSEMMIDPFGNYLFQKLLERAKPLQKLEMIRTVSHHLVAAALNLHGTRSVQKLVEVCATSSEVVELDSDGHEAHRIKLAELIVTALKDDAVRLCIDSNGNHVIQRTLQYMNAEETQFVFDAVANECLTVGTHRHGCCVLQRCLDAANSVQKRQVIAQVEKQAMKLMQDPYGNYVVQYVLDSCTPTEALGVMTKPLGHVFELSIQKFSSNVIEKCLEKAPPSVLSCYVEELIGYPSLKMQKMLHDQFANYVVQRALCVAMEIQCMALVKSIRPHLNAMKNTSGGRRITARILKRFPHLDLHLETNGFGEFTETDVGLSSMLRGSSSNCGSRERHGGFGSGFGSSFGLE